jgi:F-type H+-transporting ATPase subunit epsilon
MLLDVYVLSAKEVIFEGKAKSVILPGEQGEFEILPFHKPILSRLIFGRIYIDEDCIPIRRGIVKGYYNNVTVLIEGRQ